MAPMKVLAKSSNPSHSRQTDADTGKELYPLVMEALSPEAYRIKMIIKAEK